MRTTNKRIGWLVLALALIACNASISMTEVVPATATVTTSIPAGGFTAGTPVDVTTLPALAQVPGGGEPVSCFSESSEPSITWGYGIFPQQSLCLNNFPTAPDSPGFTVRLSDPAGRSFQESFTYSQEGILNFRGARAGYIENGQGIDGSPATPGVNVQLYMPASLPCGDWQVSAKTEDGSIEIGPIMLTADCSVPRLSVLTDLDTNPFIAPATGREGPAFDNNETIYVVGTAYPPNTPITVAFYQEDPAAGTSQLGKALQTAKYATSIMTDNGGNFQAPFVVSAATQRGAYYAVAAPTITADMGLGPFREHFFIKFPAVSVTSCASASGPAASIIDPRPVEGVQTVGQIDRSLGGGAVQSREFTIELLLYCSPSHGPTSMETYYLSDIQGLALYYKWRYDGTPQTGTTSSFSGYVPALHGHIEQAEALNPGDMNHPGTNALGIHLPEEALPGFAGGISQRYLYLLQSPSGQLSGAALSFELQPGYDGIQPVNITINVLSDSELESLKSTLPPVTP